MDDKNRCKNVEEELKAANQQLRASEQQLRASNQQLRASEQQLKASNQQLRASEQQLRAANQQLKANEQQLLIEISERKLAEKAIRESERKMQAIFNQTFQFIGLMTVDGILIEANRTALKFSGIEASSVLNKPFWLGPWWSHSPELQEKVHQAVGKVARGEFIRFEATHLDKDGTVHYVDFSLKPVKDETGKIIFLIPEGRDITERKQAEEELRKAYIKLKETQDQLIQAEKLNAVGLLASGVAHEVRNPLGIMIQGVNYLEKKIAPKDKDISETLDMIKNSIKRADKVIRGLLDFSKATTLHLHPENINSILENALILIKNQPGFKNIEIVKDLKADIPGISVDKNKIEQVCINILLNAAQAMHEGGKIIIRSYDKILKEAVKGPGERDENHFKAGERAVIIEFEDTGVGIPEESINKIFDPFFTTKSPRGGTGLGLSVSLSIINMHKGLIYAQSQVGKGTKITVILKMAKR
jgi:PAS domain S-box-containing protein